jgi:predicted nucleic acid-binding protein
MIIVSNTTPIISLLKAGALDVLEKLFREVNIYRGVFDELANNEAFKEEAQAVRGCKFIKVVSVENEFAVKLLQKNLGLDLGES